MNTNNNYKIAKKKLSIKSLLTILISVSLLLLAIVVFTSLISNYLIRSYQESLVTASYINSLSSDIKRIIIKLMTRQELILTARKTSDLNDLKNKALLNDAFDRDQSEILQFSQQLPELQQVVKELNQSYREFNMTDNKLYKVTRATLNLRNELLLKNLDVEQALHNIYVEAENINGFYKLKSARQFRPLRQILNNTSTIESSDTEIRKFITQSKNALLGYQFKTQQLTNQIIINIENIIAIMLKLSQEKDNDMLISIKENELMQPINNILLIFPSLKKNLSNEPTIQIELENMEQVFKRISSQLVYENSSIYNLRYNLNNNETALQEMINQLHQKLLKMSGTLYKFSEISASIEKNAGIQTHRVTIISYYIILTISVFALGFLSLLGLYIIGSIIRPISAMTILMDDIANGRKNLSFRTATEVHKELATVSSAFNNMVEKVERSQTDLIKLNLAYERFVPHEGLNLLEKNNILEVELGNCIQKRMTVLFADIRGFTSLSERMSTAETFDFINMYLGQMEPIIKNHEGFIDKYIGDAIMALFPSVNGAADAIAAAIALFTRLDNFNKYRILRGLDPINIGIGINTGELMLGTIGGSDRMEETVIGDTVNLASRMESTNKVFNTEILISAETYNEVKKLDLFHIRFIGYSLIKGKELAEKIYEVLDSNNRSLFAQKQTTLNDFNMACKLFIEKDYEAAKTIFETCHKNSPHDSVVTYYLSFIETQLNR